MALPRWLSILKHIGPIIIAVAVPGIGPILAPIIVSAIAEAEKIPGASGAQKKAAALELVKAGAAGVNAASKGKVVINPTEAAVVADSAITTVIGAVNLVNNATPDA